MNEQGNRLESRQIMSSVALFAVLVLCAGNSLVLAQGKSGRGASGSNPGGAVAGNPVAILDSTRTQTYFSQAYGTCVLNSADPNALGGLEYKRYWGGWEEVLKEMQAAGTIPGYDVVSDDFIVNGLARSKYKALILSNNANMSQAMVDAVRNWVAGGGHLLATFGSGYDAAAASINDAQNSRPNKNSLEQLWQDPLTDYVTTGIFGTVSPSTGGYPAGSVEPTVTQLAGPTANYCRFYDPVAGVCPWYFNRYQLISGYGDLGIMLVGRSANYPGTFAQFSFANNLAIYDPNNLWPDTEYGKSLPAVVASNYKKGVAVYYAFAPEFIVGLEFDVAGHCFSDPNYPGGDPTPWQQGGETSLDHNHWVGRTPELRALMKSSIYYLLTAQ